jgi:hypothetical protein
MSDVIKAFDLWVELTGVDPNSNSWSSKDWDVRNANEELKRSLELDTSTTLTMLLLDFFVREYLNSRKFTVQSILDDYSVLADYLKKCKTLYAILESEDLMESKNIYKTTVFEALKKYSLTSNPAVVEMAEDYHILAFLRRDALNSMETLSVHQFSQGASGTMKPVYLENIHQFWNINSLIVALSNMTHDGITLNYVEDPHMESSFFAFGIRNGGTITVLTDKPYYVDPNQKYRSRSRATGRSLHDRIARHHFPYSILDIEVDDTQRAYIKTVKSTGIIPYKTEFIPVKKLSELHPDEVIWAIMMFSLIEERFFKNEYKTPLLSYTGEMVANSNKLLEVSRNALVTQGYKPVEVPYLQASDVTTDNVESNYSFKPTHQYDWIEDRYKDEINNDLLNVVGTGRSNFVLAGSVDKELSVSGMGGGILGLESTYFETEEQIQKDHLWTARYNKTVQLQILVDREFKLRKGEILDWYKTRVIENLPILLQGIARGKVIVPSLIKSPETEINWDDDEDWAYTSSGSAMSRNRDGNILRSSYMHNLPHRSHMIETRLFGSNSEYNNATCVVTNTKASILSTLYPVNIESLLVITGCTSVDELPDILRHWRHEPLDDGGNSRLDRLDPMDWLFNNPWQKDLDLRVLIFLSKSGFNKVRKLCGLPFSESLDVENLADY